MAKKTFLISYTAFDSSNRVIKEGQFKVKNQESEIGAKINFEKYLQRTLKGFHRLYIKKCTEMPFSGQFGDIFNDMFGGQSDIDDLFKGFCK